MRKIDESIDSLATELKGVESDIQGAISGFQGTIAIADIPTADGIYSPTEAGTYQNAGGLIYAPEGVDEGFDVKFIKTGSNWVKNRVEIGNKIFSKGVFDVTATINSDYPDVFKAIKKVELYNADPTKRYFLKYFGRNRYDAGGLHEGKYYFIIEEEDAGSTLGVAVWNQILTENPNGITEVELGSYSAAGITGKAWVDWNEVSVSQHNPYIQFPDINTGILSSSVHAAEGVREKLNQLTYNIIAEIEIGGLSSINGVLIENNIRARTKEIEVSQGTYKFNTVLPAGFIASNYILYDADGVFIQGFSSASIPSEITIPDGVNIIRLSFRKSDNSVITQSELDSIHITISLPDSDIGYGKIQEDIRNLKSDVKAISSGGEWFGKKLSVLGDSISYGFIPRNALGYPGQLNSYAKLAAESLGMIFENKGISGSTLGAMSLGTTSRSPFVYRYQDLDDIADLVLVMGGTNDIRNGIPLGTFSDTDETTYYGALHVLCLGLLDKYKHAQGIEIGKTKHIVFCTPIKMGIDLTPDLKPYCEAVKEVCAYYSIPVWDAYNLSGINPHILRTVQGTETGYTDMYNPYITDGTHPTQEGHQIMADAFVGFLKTI